MLFCDHIPKDNNSSATLSSHSSTSTYHQSTKANSSSTDNPKVKVSTKISSTAKKNIISTTCISAPEENSVKLNRTQQASPTEISSSSDGLLGQVLDGRF